MEASAFAALCFLPFVLPICLYVAYTDLAEMKIKNKAVLVLGAVFVVIGPLVMPFNSYLWQLTHIPVILILGMLLNAGGVMGAGDAKFLTAAAPFVAVGDLQILALLFALILIAALVTHRLARASQLRSWAPEWESWTAGKKFPMGLALGPTLALYLCLAALNSA